MSASTAVAPGRSPAVRVAAAVVVLLAGCGGGEETAGGAGGSPEASATSAAPLPETEDLAALQPLTIHAEPFPDFALTVGDVVWVSGVDPGIVAYDAVSGEIRARATTGGVPLAMEQGFGSLWAGEDTGTLVRIDPSTGAVVARVPVSEVGIRPESSVAVTDEAVWVMTDEVDGTRLVAVDPTTNAVRATFPAPEAAAAVRGGFGSLWVATSAGTVVRLDPADGSEQASIGTGSGSRFTAVGDDAVWVLNQNDGTVSRIDPATNDVAATVRASAGPVRGGDIAVGDGAVWVRSQAELATQIDPSTDRVVRVLGPAAGSGSIAVTDGGVWITAHDELAIHRVPTV